MRRLFLGMIASSLLWPCASAWAAPAVTWTPMPRQWPIARLEAPMVYDSVNQRLVLFGGYDRNWNRYNDVWEYTPAAQSWRNVTPSGGAQPVPRSGSSMAYDPVHQRVVLFGGLNDARQFLGDTWEWDCNAHTWTQFATGGVPGTNKPTPREGLQLSYEPASDRVLLFGGRDGIDFYGDTWRYNVSTHTWSLLATTSTSSLGRVFRKRAFHGMAVAGTRPFVFAGLGYDGAGSPIYVFEDIWELVGTVWTDRTPSPPGVHNGACANPAICPGRAGWRAFGYDAAGNRLVTEGGYYVTLPPNSTTGDLKETWAFSLASLTWSKVSDNIGGADSIGARDSHAFAYDSARARLMLFGGFLADLWELSGSTWSAPPQFNPFITYNVYTYPRQDYHAMAWDSTRNRLLLVSGGEWDTWAFNPAGWYWSFENFAGFDPPRVGQAVAYSPVVDAMMMFGGRCKSMGMYQTQPDGVGSACGAAGTLFNQLLSFNPTTKAWTTLSPSGGPPSARWDHTFVYDPAHNEFVLFGGRNAAGSPLADTWVLSCASATSCTWTAGGAGPGGRYGHSMAYDPGTQRVVLFGGFNGSLLSDVWAWNGATNSWSTVAPAGTAPSGRLHAALVQADRVTPGLLLFGGASGSGPQNDAWLLTNAGGASPSWQSVVVAGAAPLARENPKMVFASSLNRMLMYGGFNASGLLPGDPAQATLTVKGDMDATGSTDLVLRSPSTSQPVIWTMAGVNRLAELLSSNGLGASEQVAGVDDFDYDGRNDFMVWNAASGAVNFWRMSGATYLGSTPLGGTAPLSPPWSPAATADFNHDSKPDILWRNATTQKLAIWVLSGTNFGGAYAPYPDQAIDSNWAVVGALDYDADGNTDLLWYNATSGKIVFWFLDYNAQRITGQFANPANAGDNNWKVRAAGDYGTPGSGPLGTKDIVWRNETSGRFVVWYMDWAGNRVAGVFTNPMEPGPNPTLWDIVGPR